MFGQHCLTLVRPSFKCSMLTAARYCTNFQAKSPRDAGAARCAIYEYRRDFLLSLYKANRNMRIKNKRALQYLQDLTCS